MRGGDRTEQRGKERSGVEEKGVQLESQRGASAPVAKSPIFTHQNGGFFGGICGGLIIVLIYLTL